MRKQRVRDPTKVKHDIFMECAKTEKMPFWKHILEDCAYGQFPRGMTFREGMLFYKKGKHKSASTKHLPENVQEAKTAVINFFKNEIGVLSKDEILRQKMAMRVKMGEILRPHDTVWKDIRAPTTQRQILLNYALTQQDHLNLNIDQAYQLYTVLVVGLAIGTIIPDDIEMDRGVIISVDNIERLPNGYFTVRRSLDTSICFKVKSNTKQTGFANNWK